MNRTERILLWLRLDPMTDPADMLTWTVDGKPLSGGQLCTLLGFTLADADDALTLMRLDNELSQS